MKYLLIIVAVLTVVFIAGFIWFSNQKKPQAKINNKTFALYVAKSGKDKEIGLSKYNKISENQGMIFQFEKDGFYPFWMKEMKFPIDIIYINDGKIVTVYKNVPTPSSSNPSPPIYTNLEPADTVLEVNAGLSQKYNFKEGDKVSFSNI